MRIQLELKRTEIIQIVTTLITFFFTIGLPIINFITSQNLEIFNEYNYLIILITLVGTLISLCSYLFFKYPRFSVQRGTISLCHSILDTIFLSLFSQMAVINIISTNECTSCSSVYSGISLNLSGIFLLLIAISSLFIVKNLYDLLDFNLNKNFYDVKRKEQSYITKTNNKRYQKPSGTKKLNQ